MTECIESQITFSFYSPRQLTADFAGGQITSDAGRLALRQFDHQRRLTASLVRALTDPRCSNKVEHSLASLLRQRLYQIVSGYEDANDADRLRHDPTFPLLADREVGAPLASQPTLSRWENAFSARDWVRLNRLLLEWFCQLCSEQVRARGEIVLDLDSTADPTHGQQEFSFYNGAYGEPIYHPLLVFERHTGCLLAAHLRPGQAGSPSGCIAVLRRLLLRLLRRFPGIPIRLCADAGFPLPPALRSAQIETLRNRVFKLGARIRQTARRVGVHGASGWPFQTLFGQLCRSLDTS